MNLDRDSIYKHRDNYTGIAHTALLPNNRIEQRAGQKIQPTKRACTCRTTIIFVCDIMFKVTVTIIIQVTTACT